MYAWETSFNDMVRKVRSPELKCLKTQALINVASGFAYYNSKYLVNVRELTVTISSIFFRKVSL